MYGLGQPPPRLVRKEVPGGRRKPIRLKDIEGDLVQHSRVKSNPKASSTCSFLEHIILGNFTMRCSAKNNPTQSGRLQWIVTKTCNMESLPVQHLLRQLRSTQNLLQFTF